ncbi:MAG: glycoside hydrolase family 28 protein [Aristaeellaceae bacterium]
MSAIYDVPTYPELGHIYPGDYYDALPFGDYINREQPLPAGENVFDIRDFGAVPELYRLNTDAFMAAAHQCEQAGGGTILVAGGSYWMGAVKVPANTTLFIAADAEIVASRSMEHMQVPASEGQGNEHGTTGFLCVDGVKNVVITGGGRICGNGEWYVYEPREKPALTAFPLTALPRRDQAGEINTVPDTVRYYYRQRIRYAEDKYGEGLPRLVRPGFFVLIRGSEDVRVENVILHGSMAWTLNLECSRRVTVRNVVIDDNRHVANTDGIDITGSSDVLIDHCFISCADDGIVAKNPIHTNRAMSNIRVQNCTVVTVMNAFKIGTETAHDIRDIRVENCHFCMPDIYPGSVSGISLESCDGSHVSDVTIRSITMDKVLCPLYICLNMRNRYASPAAEEGGSIGNITIENIRAENAELPCIITGFEAKKADGTVLRRPVENVAIRHYRVTYRDNAERVQLPESYDEFLRDYPESNAHGDVDAYGIWARHVNNLSLTDIAITPRSCNTREMIVLRDVK